ncbi:MAG: bifunctional 5,10-methylenetetrahydrofolate dehydrogenase/5,10-methenyltetrahydrofolate cyclohydrolase [Firmicutes bacterium]|nr:bifunctional 5,10-methylenetetrahydrofolate dehydrogenase/5,10-methenyltetrahydrofolate cyclohydrolase [Bacillota bacterium]
MLLDGKKLRDKILEEIKVKISEEKIKAKLVIISVGDNEASKIYIKNKEKACLYVGIEVEKYILDKNVDEEFLIDLINSLNNDNDVTGIILQSPIPSHLNFDYVASFIDANKDVDGFTKENIYDLYLNQESLIPCTVKGIIRLLEEYEINLTGKDVLIVGRGKIVGLPLSIALLNKNATVTIAHSKTKDLKEKCLKADIIIAAVGAPKLIKEDMVKDGAIVVDVGISRVDGKVVGDVDYENVHDKCQYITKTPGGVGPMTVAMILENILIAKERNEKNGQGIKRCIK